MVLFVPKGARCRVKNRMVTVRRFPMLGVEGAAWLERMALGTHNGVKRRQFFFSIHHRRQAEIFG